MICRQTTVFNVANRNQECCIGTTTSRMVSTMLCCKWKLYENINDIIQSTANLSKGKVGVKCYQCQILDFVVGGGGCYLIYRMNEISIQKTMNIFSTDRLNKSLLLFVLYTIHLKLILWIFVCLHLVLFYTRT